MDDAQTQATLQTILRFHEPFSRGDVDAIMAATADDCTFENTYPPPDGMRVQGAAAIRAFWEAFFQASQNPRIEAEEIFACGDRGVMRWIYRWEDDDGAPHHIRGVDIFRIRNGQIAEKLSYVKG